MVVSDMAKSSRSPTLSLFFTANKLSFSSSYALDHSSPLFAPILCKSAISWLKIVHTRHLLLPRVIIHYYQVHT
jgi:hypothetical protein